MLVTSGLHHHPQETLFGSVENLHIAPLTRIENVRNLVRFVSLKFWWNIFHTPSNVNTSLLYVRRVEESGSKPASEDCKIPRHLSEWSVLAHLCVCLRELLLGVFPEFHTDACQKGKQIMAMLLLRWQLGLIDTWALVNLPTGPTHIPFGAVLSKTFFVTVWSCLDLLNSSWWHFKQWKLQDGNDLTSWS